MIGKTKMEGDNQKLTHEQCEFIRSLEDFDLTMIVSEIHDHGWPIASKTLEFMKEAIAKRKEY
jgi:hypothetical protein